MPRRRRTIAISYPRDPATSARVSAVAERTDQRNGLGAASKRWRPLTCTAADLRSSAPTLALDDYSEIPFVKSVVGVEWYQYRARLRCEAGDCYAVAADGIEGRIAVYEQASRAGNLLVGAMARREIERVEAGRAWIEGGTAIGPLRPA